MATYRNMTSQGVAVRTKDGNVSIRAGETSNDITLADKSPRNSALLHAKAIVEVKSKDQPRQPQPQPNPAPVVKT